VAVRDAPGARVVGESDRGWAVRACALQRLRWHAGCEREPLGDVHLRRVLGRPAGRECAVRRRVRCAQPVALMRAGDPLGGQARGARRVRARGAALSGEARRVAGSCWSDRVRVARAGVRRPRSAIDARGAVAGLLPRDAHRDGTVRCRGVERASGRIRSLLQPALAPVNSVRRRAGRRLRAPAAERAGGHAYAPRRRRPRLHRDRHHHVRRFQQWRGVA
jgi:hypothetical protein